MLGRGTRKGEHHPDKSHFVVFDCFDGTLLEYFRTRLVKAPRDADYALGLTVQRCRTREQQEAAVAALRFKTEMLWAQLDAIERGDSQNAIPPTPRT
jgi:pyrroloquinoline-quinone synthase